MGNDVYLTQIVLTKNGQQHYVDVNFILKDESELKDTINSIESSLNNESDVTSDNVVEKVTTAFNKTSAKKITVDYIDTISTDMEDSVKLQSQETHNTNINRLSKR